MGPRRWRGFVPRQARKPDPRKRRGDRVGKKKEVDMTILPEEERAKKRVVKEKKTTKKIADKKVEKKKETAQKPKKEIKGKVKEKKIKKTKKTAETEKPKENIRKKALHGKSYRTAKGLIDKDKKYSLDEALDLLPKLANKKFNESVELSGRLNIKIGKGEAGLRTQITMPHSTGKVIRVAALTSKVDAAKKAGAYKAGADDLLEEIKAGKTDFDILITESSMMPKVAPLAKILGPKGLMPNPKSGTIVADIEKGVKELAGGKTEIKSDISGSIHVMVGKVKDKKEDLKENVLAVLELVKSTPGLSYKGQLIQTLTLSSTMSPGIKLDVANL